MLRPSIATLALIISGPAGAQMYEGEYTQCNELSTMGIVQCVSEKTKVWDARLNETYQMLRQHLEPEERQALLKAQRLWIQYRDANCEFYFSGPGTISRIASAECLRSMTQQRTCELEMAQAGGDRAVSEWCR